MWCAYDFVFRHGDSVVYLIHGPATANVETLSAWAEQRWSKLGAEALDASAPIVLDGEAQTVSFGFEMAGPLAVWRGEQTHVVRDGVVYVVTLTAPRGSNWRADFEPLLSGWRWSS